MKMPRLFIILLVSGLVACGSAPKEIKSPARIQAELAHRNALLAIRDGRIESAAAEWRSALLAYQSIDDWQGQGMARLGLAQIQARLGDQSSAEQVLAPLLQLETFSAGHKTQAAVQMAQLFQLKDRARASAYLRMANEFCAQPCRLEVQILNLNAKIALRGGELELAQGLAQQALSLAATNRAEAAFSQRILAEVAMAQQQYAAALAWLEQAILLDRQSAEPLWLLDNYRLMHEIARQSGDAPLLTRAEVHLSSLCAALDCSP
jgi:tetratricopeptide (TPR) repeat protein